MRKFRIKGRDSPWFTAELPGVLHERNAVWAKARRSGTEADCLLFRQLRNKCTSLFRKAKSEFYLTFSDENLNNQGNSGKQLNHYLLLKSLMNYHLCIVQDSIAVHNKVEMVNCFN